MAWDYLKNASSKNIVDGVMKDKPGKAAEDIKPDRKRVVEEVTIRKVDNGFTASIRYMKREEKNNKGEPTCHYEEPSTKIFKNASEAGALLEECFGS
jgi:hypothetical protein